MDFEVVADGVLLGEGPVAMPDGSVVLVDVVAGNVLRAWGAGRTEVIAKPGGGPNGAALGPDGALYIANNGGLRIEFADDGAFNFLPGLPDTYDGGRIERVDLTTGKVERLYSECNGHQLRGPNDLVFDREGGMWFTDFGKTAARTRDISGLYYAKADGSLIQEAYFGALSFNGVGLSPDESRVYAADSMSGRLWEFEIESPGKVKLPDLSRATGRFIGKARGASAFDSLAVTEAGNICVATIGMEQGVLGGITTFTPDGQRNFRELPDPFVTNICFGGADLRTAYITSAGTRRLVRTRWHEPGLALNYCTY